MENNISEIEKKLQNYVNTNTDGDELVLSSDFKLFFLRTITDNQYISESIEKAYFESTINFDQYIYTIGTVSDLYNPDDILLQLTEGFIIAIYKNKVFQIAGALKREKRELFELTNEISFEGSTESFNEECNININLIRKYYRSINLVVSEQSIGTVSNSRVAVLYDSSFVNKDILNSLLKSLKKVNMPVIQSLNELQQVIWNHQILIPRVLVTQRPDRVVKNLSLGKIVVFLDGTPTAMVLPVCFHDFMTTVDDNYLLPLPASFIIGLRYFGIILSLLLPAGYVAVTAYNPEIVRVQLALSIEASRSGVPYPSFLEVTIMLLLMEFLLEASLRLPKSIGQAATTVGGLILGQAAIQANLVSNIMIMIIATVAISSFTIPTVSMNLTVRVAKYIILLLANFSGVFGIYVGFFIMSCYIFSIHTFNTEYFNPLDKFSLKKVISFFNKGANQ